MRVEGDPGCPSVRVSRGACSSVIDLPSTSARLLWPRHLGATSASPLASVAAVAPPWADTYLNGTQTLAGKRPGPSCSEFVGLRTAGRGSGGEAGVGFRVAHRH